jgi:hypothetical protein
MKATAAVPNEPGTVVEQTVTKTRTSSGAERTPPGNPVFPLEDENINDWFRRLTPAQRSEHMIYYLHRQDPNIEIVDKALPGDRGFGGMLDKIEGADLNEIASRGEFLQELSLWILRKGYGGGPYRIWITYTKERGRTLFNKIFQVPGEPIPSDREQWVGAQRGQSGDTAMLPMVMRIIEQKINDIKGGHVDPQIATNQAMQTVAGIMGTTFQLVMDKMPKADDPTTQLQRMRETILLVDSLKPKDPPKSELETFKGFLDLQRQLMPPAPAAPAAPAVTETTINEIVTKAISAAADRFKGRNPASNEPGWGPTLIQIGKDLIPVLGPIVGAGAEFLIARTRAMVSAAPAPGAPGATYAPPVGGPVQRLNAPPITATAPIQPPIQTGQPAMPTQPVRSEADVLFDHARAQIVEMVIRGVPGDQCAASLALTFPMIAGQLRAFPEPVIMQFIANDPVLKAVKDHPRLPEFVAQFCAYFKEEFGAPEPEPPNPKAN